MPKLKRLSGCDVLAIFVEFGFESFSQRGSHIKLPRTLRSTRERPQRSTDRPSVRSCERTPEVLLQRVSFGSMTRNALEISCEKMLSLDAAGMLMGCSRDYVRRLERYGELAAVGSRGWRRARTSATSPVIPPKPIWSTTLHGIRKCPVLIGKISDKFESS